MMAFSSVPAKNTKKVCTSRKRAYLDPSTLGPKVYKLDFPSSFTLLESCIIFKIFAKITFDELDRLID
jgi:hypothetical protein